MSKEINIFDKPYYYRDILKNIKLIDKEKMSKYEGKSLICVFFTAYCGVGCPFCFFHSPNSAREPNDFIARENHFSNEGVNKFIKFANDSNVGYLQISGGGEPFLEIDAIVKCIEKISCERIILVTSGSWASSRINAEKYLNRLYMASLKNKSNPRITIRLSVSEYHSIRLKEKPLINLINIFQEKYSDIKNFTLQLKIFESDNTLEKYLKEYYQGYTLSLIENNGTDDEKYIKVMPWKYKLRLRTGYEIIVGKSRIFNSNLRPDLYNDEEIKKSVNIYDVDLNLSQNDFPSILHNSDGKTGLDWIVEYNGNVCTWQNRVQDNLLNIYEDSYKNVLEVTMNDLLTYSYIDKGSKYRENIINEISPRTVLLMKSVNIRDYAGTLAFADEKIRLYYNIRVIQDYILENKINLKSIKKIPQELIDAVWMDKKDLIDLYKHANYSILDQELKKPLNPTIFHDFLELVKLGHYEISDNDKAKAIEIYNSISDETNILSINDVKNVYGMEVERRLTRRLMTRKKIKKENKKVLFYLYRHGETNWNVENRIKGQLEDLKTNFTNLGYNQIENITKKIKNDNIEAIFTSDLLRTKDTANIINLSLNLPLYYCKNFRGLNMGNFQGQLMSEFLNNPDVKKAFVDYDFVIPGGESINQLVNRYEEGLDIIVNEYNYRRVAIISHGAAISNIKSKISNQPYEDVDYCVIEYDNNTYKVIDYGEYGRKER